MNKRGTIWIWVGVVVVVGTLGWLASSGYSANKQYFVKVPELYQMGEKAHTSHLRVDGFVQPGSIQQSGTSVTFVMNEFESHSAKAPGQALKVVYKGSEPPPDTFKDDSEAVADGSYGQDGVFHATALQAKCASKYAPAAPGEQKPKQAAPPTGKANAARGAQSHSIDLSS